MIQATVNEIISELLFKSIWYISVVQESSIASWASINNLKYKEYLIILTILSLSPTQNLAILLVGDFFPHLQMYLNEKWTRIIRNTVTNRDIVLMNVLLDSSPKAARASLACSDSIQSTGISMTGKSMTGIRLKVIRA